jgi:uncharacterized protein with GYD domain
MPTFVVLTKLSPEALKRPQSAEDLGRQVTQRIHQEIPEAKWVGSYALLGPYDYLDIFDAPSEEVAQKVTMLIRSFGHATTETWVATPWDRYLGLVRGL